MTIRNFLPGFGMRTVAALAAVTAVVIAALLAVGSPASAQSSLNETEIFSSTITVGSHPSLDIKGYYDVGSNTYGAMSFSDFPSVVNSASDHYSIQHLIDSPAGNQLHLGLFIQLEDLDQEAYTLHIGERSFDFAHATYSFETATSIHAYSWSLSPRFGWATGQTVAVKITALPIVTIEAVTTTVEYGGNDNAADSVAEFRFTRTGGTDEALSFTLNHSGVGFSENATRTFNAGQSSFSNFHWAVDVDNNGNPQCFISWQIFDRSHYVRGTPASALVTVEGPGTTCMSGI